MAYRFVLLQQAAKDLRALDHSIGRRIVQKLHWLEKQDNPLSTARRLREPAAGDIRFRVGDYRLIGIIDETTKCIVIVKIGHRRSIYF